MRTFYSSMFYCQMVPKLRSHSHSNCKQKLKKIVPVYFFRKHKHNCFCIHEVVSGLRQPVGAVHCGDGSQRLFILEKEGYVKILTPEGDIVKEPFLDIHKLVQSGIKVGLLLFIVTCPNTCNLTFSASSVLV